MPTQSTFRTIEVKLYPSKTQMETLSSWLRVCCWIYNRVLEQRIKAYKRRKESPTLYDQQKLLTLWRSRMESLRLVPVQFERDALRRADRGMKAFFRRVKQGAKRKGFPRFKASRRWKSIECLLAFNYGRGKQVFVPGMGLIRYRGQRLQGVQKSLKIIRRETGWYAQLLVVGPPNKPQIEPQNAIGIDVGLNKFATLSNDESVANPRILRRSERKLRIAQRRSSRKLKDSCNRRKAFRKVARIRKRIGAQRKGFAHQLSRRVVDQFDLIGVEDLNIKGLAGGILAKSVNDAGWGRFLFYLLYKAASAGKQVVKVDPRGTSQTCPNCGAVKAKLLSERRHRCECGLDLDRDHAAALVIEARALAVVGATRLWRGLPLCPTSRSDESGPDEARSPSITLQ